MSPQASPVRPVTGVLLLSCIVITLTNILPVSAHKVEIAEDVGGTLHLEPNDNPPAGEAVVAWFALTRKGGQVIPLEQCNCQLAIYTEPHSADSPALLKPPLKPVSAERYQGIPGAEITFPQPGAYQLQLSGKPAPEADFKPFQLKFNVTVAAGSAAPATTATPTAQLPSQPAEQGQTGDSPRLAVGITLSILVSMGIFWWVVQRRK